MLNLQEIRAEAARRSVEGVNRHGTWNTLEVRKMLEEMGRDAAVAVLENIAGLLPMIVQTSLAIMESQRPVPEEFKRGARGAASGVVTAIPEIVRKKYQDSK